MNKQQGFALIELIAVIVLVGIIASFSTFFLYTGFNGYINSKNATEGALNAQMALDRISQELRNISELTSTPSSTSLSYKSEDQTETRTLKYENQSVFIRVNTTDHMLLDNISTFTITKAPLKIWTKMGLMMFPTLRWHSEWSSMRMKLIGCSGQGFSQDIWLKINSEITFKASSLLFRGQVCEFAAMRFLSIRPKT